MDIFNNREIAVGVWLVIFVIWILSKPNLRKTLKNLVVQFLTSRLVIPFILLVVHVLVSVWLLSYFELWQDHQIKNTVLWFFTVAAVSFFRLHKIKDDLHYFKNAIKDHVKIILVIEFLITSYTFSLVVELVFIPFTALMGGVLALAQSDIKYSSAEKSVNHIFSIIGIIVVLFIVYKISTEPSDLLQVKTLYDFLVPIFLSCLLLPYIYMLHLYSTYERVLQRLGFSIKDKQLELYAKRRGMINFNLHATNLNRWSDSLNYIDISSKLDVDDSIVEAKRCIAEEKNPPIVPHELGWSPYLARLYLIDEGLVVGFYKKIYDKEWTASSSYIKAGHSGSINNISYYLRGESGLVKQLKLKMNVYDKKYSKIAHERLLEVASSLYFLALGQEINEKVSQRVLKGENYEASLNSKNIRVLNKEWHNANGYEVGFVIENPSM